MCCELCENYLSKQMPGRVKGTLLIKVQSQNSTCILFPTFEKVLLIEELKYNCSIFAHQLVFKSSDEHWGNGGFTLSKERTKGNWFQNCQGIF